ncbi:hypothetical protein JCM21900_006983 [Sporobolomyces salmonicolor]
MSEITAAVSSSSSSSSSFRFSPSLPSAHEQPHSGSPPLASPVSPTASMNFPPPPGSNASTASTTPQSDAPTPLFERSSSSMSGTSSAARPVPPARGTSFTMENDIWGSSFSGSAGSLTGSSSGGGGMGMGGTAGAVGEPAIQRTARAASDGSTLSSALGGASTAALSPTGRLSSLGSDDSSEEQALFREHQRRSLEHSANARLVNSIHPSTMATTASTSTSSTTSGSSRAFGSATSPTLTSATTSPFFAPMTTVSSNSSSAMLPPLLSPTSQSPPTATQLPPFSPAHGTDADLRGATLHLGDLDVWMDEQYVRECCKRMGWDSVVSVKMSRGASPSSGYCFLTFPSPAEAARVLNRFNAGPPMLMPRSGRTFKLNWGTGVPGSVPRWEGEWSVFVGDLAREVGEQELMALFAPLFPSTKSAKVMTDPSSGLSRGYGFVRFGEESDMHRALLLGANPNSGLLLHGRTIRISEASGGANGAVEGLAPHLRERTRTRTSSEIGAAAGAGAAGYFPPYPPSPLPSHSPHDPFAPNPVISPGPGPHGEHYISPTYPTPFSPSLPLSPTAHSHFGGGGGSNGPLSPTLGGRGPASGFGREGGGGPVRAPIPPGSVPQGGDPNNTTVFVGGLPACISEETLKSFFHHFGEITYCKIPTGKGCGFVQFIRRQDAELAIAKMNDFPIHGKSRIRLSWGRSQGDKQVEHVRKLASALGVPFDAVWRMVQGQDNSTIKQIASAVGGGAGAANGAQRDMQSPQLQQQQLNGGLGGAGSMDLRAVANAAGLTESEVLDLVKAGNGLGGLASNPGSAAAASNGNSNSRGAGAGSTIPASSTGNGDLLVDRNGNGETAGGAGPYSRVSPSSFSAQQQHPMLPLSPPPSAGPAGSSFAHHQSQLPPPAAHAHGFHHHPYAVPHSHSPALFHPPPPHHAFPPPHSHQHSHSQQQQQQQHSHQPSPSPYNAIRPESYVVLSPNASPYERVDFAEGGRPTPPLNGGGGPGNDRSGYPHSQQGPFGSARGGVYDQPHAQPFPDGGANYTTSPPRPQSGANGLEDSFAGLNFGPAPSLSQPPRTLPPPPQRMSFSSASGGGIGSPTAPDFFPSALGSPTTTRFEAPEGRWSWNEVGTGSA